MQIITRDDVLAAMARFDAELRPGEYDQWDVRMSQKWAIEHAGLRYPPKVLWSLLTDRAVNSFSGGGDLNKRFVRLGFALVRLDGRPLPEPVEEPTYRDLEEQVAKLEALVAEAELRVLTEQARTRLALVALAAAGEIARHAPGCMAGSPPHTLPCSCGFARAEQLAAEATQIAADTPDLTTIIAALTAA